MCRVERGLIDADLGGCVIKQRIAHQGQSRARGFRSIILLRLGERAFFVFGFAKNEKDNLTQDEEKGFKDMAKYLLTLSDQNLEELIEKGDLWEITYDD